VSRRNLRKISPSRRVNDKNERERMNGSTARAVLSVCFVV
jgi:hypothetical protein